MFSFQKAGLVTILFAFFVATIVFGGMTICPRCGYENEEGEPSCSHCSAALPEVETPPGEETPQDHTFLDSGQLEYLSPEAVADEIALGIKHLEGKNEEVARLFFENAAALDLLTDPRIEYEHSDRILGLLKRCQEAGKRIRVPCATCGGTGKRVVRRQDSTGRETYRQLPGRSCPKCSGRGFFLTRGTVSDRKFAKGRAAEDYAMIQQSRKAVSVGNAWVPHAVADRLSDGQKAALKRSVASGCDECMGIGRADCRTCSGTGVLRCSNRKCLDGMVETRQRRRGAGSRITRREKCGICRGTGRIYCEKCLGKGNMLCDDCNGSGRRDLCRKCGGEGIVACTRCKGSGVYRGEDCKSCRGEREIMCSSCNGDGRKR